MAADALVSVGVVVSGVVIALTGWTLIDPIVGLVVAAIIVASVWSLLRDSLRLSLDGVPANIDPAKVVASMEQIEGVEAVHHLHIWAISTTENALTAHVVLTNMAQSQTTKDLLKQKLAAMGIAHATLETEPGGSECANHC